MVRSVQKVQNVIFKLHTLIQPHGLFYDMHTDHNMRKCSDQEP